MKYLRRFLRRLPITVSAAALVTIGCGSRTGAAVTTTETAAPRQGLFEGFKRMAGSPAQRCLAEAGDPDDATSGGGTALDEIPETALEACREAIKNSPGEPALLVALARAALVEDDDALAITSFTSAVERGSCSAKFFLGANKEAPWQSEAKANLAEARTYYQSAIDCGYAPAVEALDGITFDKDLFVRADLMERLFRAEEADFVELSKTRPLVSVYLSSLYSTVGEWWIPNADSCAASTLYRPGLITRQLAAGEAGDLPTGLHRAAVDALLGVVQWADPVWGPQAWERTRDILKEQGRVDGLRLLSHYPGCDASAITRQIVSSITTFAGQPRSVIEIAKEQASEPKVRGALKTIFSSLEGHGRAFDALLQ